MAEQLCTCETHELDIEECIALLASSPRISHAVSHFKLCSRKVHKSPFGRYISFTLLKELLSHLPRLRVLELVDCSWPADEQPPTPLHTIDGLEVRFMTRGSDLGCPMPWFPEDFALVRALGPLRALVLGTAMNNPYHALQRLEEESLQAPPLARVDALELFYRGSGNTVRYHYNAWSHCIDVTVLRSLTLHGPLCDHRLMFIDLPPALEAIGYRVAPAPPDFSTAPHLHSVSIFGSMCVSGRKSSGDWQYIMRDLAELPTGEIRDVKIVLYLYEDPDETGGAVVSPGDIIFIKFRHAFKPRDWELLGRRLARFPQLERVAFRLQIASVPTFSGNVPRCIRVMQDAVAQNLKGSITASTTVDVVFVTHSLAMLYL